MSGDGFEEEGKSAEGRWEGDEEGDSLHFVSWNSPPVFIGPEDFAAARARRDRLNRDLASLPPDEAAERIVQECINQDGTLRKILEIQHGELPDQA